MSEWIEWKGGRCPLPADKMVETTRRDGKSFVTKASALDWIHIGDKEDVVAYRTAESVAAVLAETDSALAKQEGGDHYRTLPIQPVAYIHKNGIGYFEGNVIKYVTRWRNKNGMADLLKAKHYIELLIELESAK
jgi:hypothetical protein